MRSVSITSLVTLAWVGAGTMAIAQEHTRLRAVPFTAVRIADEFWTPKLDVIRDSALPHCFEQCEQTGRLSNFDKAAGKVAGKFEGYFFNDSDVYKVIEGAAYTLMQQRDAELETYVDGVIDRIAAAQQEDGYLNSYFTLTPSEERWSNTRVRHELYCAGHLLEAGIAYYQATGKRTLLDVAVRFIDLIDSVFGPGKRLDVPGHEEIELALVKLYRLTGETKYLKLAQFFVEQRGHANDRELYGEYCQDHAPVREHTEVVGHAVRAMYLYTGVADLAAITGDHDYIEMMDRVWRDTVNSKMYITGGIGPSAHNEGFTVAYDLPNDSAYAETCAGIGLLLWNHRLSLLHADSRYVDVLERLLYNGVLSGLSLDGKSFNYVNPLGSRGDHHRKPWYNCACCPPNLVRIFPGIGGYVYAHADDAIYVNLYVGGRGTVKIDGDREVVLEQETRYPWNGSVKLIVSPKQKTEFELLMRVPGWCRDATLTVAGRKVTPFETRKGYARVRRTWTPGDVVELDLPMPIERIQADPRVQADVGREALQRGPLVYCLEAADNSFSVRNVALQRDAKLVAEHRPDLLGGVTVVRGIAQAAVSTPSDDWEQALYQPACDARPVEFDAIPYYAWDNRQPGEMVVWLPESLMLVGSPPVSWVSPSASNCWRADTLTALHDRQEPANSNDHGLPRFSWWPRRGGVEWVQYDFDSPRAVSSVALYWFDDGPKNGGCRVPASWKLSYRDGDSWRPVESASDFGVEPDRYNRVTFDPVKTDGLRIEAQLQDEMSGGILEWQVGLAD